MLFEDDDNLTGLDTGLVRLDVEAGKETDPALNVYGSFKDHDNYMVGRAGHALRTSFEVKENAPLFPLDIPSFKTVRMTADYRGLQANSGSESYSFQDKRRGDIIVLIEMNKHTTGSV